MFGSPTYLNNNIFVTSHQIANVYTRPAAHYEVRCDEKSIDIQVDEGVASIVSDAVISSKDTPINEDKKENPNRVDSSKNILDFYLKRLGKFRIGIVGNVDAIVHLVKKFGGCKTNERIIIGSQTYAGGYTIPLYNLERFLKSMEKEGWNTEGIFSMLREN